jgi:spermidine synthase
MMAFLLFMPQPRDVLMIGLGGGSLAKFCYRHLPQTRISVIEINADVISLREHFAIPPDGERFEIVHEDGATFLARVPVTPDVILIDAFDDIGVAPSLASPDFYHRASQSLTSDGVLVMNLSGQKSRYPVPVQSLREAFDGAVVLLPVQVDGNVLLFAFKKPHLVEIPETLHDRAAELEKALGLEFRKFLQYLRAGPTLY